MFATARGVAQRRFRGWNAAGRTPTASTAATTSVGGAIRNLNLHEYPSMELMREHGIRTPRGYLASNPEEAGALFRRNFSRDSEEKNQEPIFHEAVLKAQVLSGGRNSGVGGVLLVSNPEEAHEFAEQMLGHKLLTQQATEKVPYHQVMLVERLRLKRELYVSILMDRNSQSPILIGSAYGWGSHINNSGRSIADIARSRPDSIYTEHIDIVDGLETDQCERMAENLGLDPNSTPAFDQAVTMMTNLYSMFTKCDCTMIEVNTLGETHAGDIVAVDAKVQFDDNALFRQERIVAQRGDWHPQDPREARAMREGIDYIGMDGSIGCMVNGAGLAMATMDLIHSKGGAPSNFLDVGGGASEHQVKTALAILEADPRVKVILVNIFGGLMRCDVIANGILDVSREIGIQTPMVLRLQGTNYEEAKALIAEQHCGEFYGDIRLVDDLDEAANMAVAIAEGDDSLAISALVRDAVIAKGMAIPRFEGFSL